MKGLKLDCSQHVTHQQFITLRQGSRPIWDFFLFLLHKTFNLKLGVSNLQPNCARVLFAILFSFHCTEVVLKYLYEFLINKSLWYTFLGFGKKMCFYIFFQNVKLDAGLIIKTKTCPIIKVLCCSFCAQ